jgi:predicted adenine nucleotide alpha hydrolase (AANH) superfamily ATPase
MSIFMNSAPERILVHTCCAPCAAPSAERLILHGMAVTLFFCNANIWPEAEYRRRLAAARKLAKILDVAIEEDQYDHAAWREAVKGLEHEPEKGARCRRCFEFNLGRTAQLADRLDFPAFTTTLTLAPQKVSRMIFEVGRQFPKYRAWDFKKEDGFLRSLQLSREYDLYRQNYCGCEFSMNRDQAVKPKGGTP